VACTLACGEPQITRYTGTTMNDAMPDSSGSLRLTLYTRTDTSFSGVMELGPPLSGGGSAYLWHEGTDLQVVTVGAVDRDTILWRSRNAGAEIGGRFEITGGPHAGQGGTWRARLTSGPPASPETLRQAQRFSPPPLSAMWPLLALALVIVAAARWIRAAPIPAATDGVAGDRSPFAPGRSLSGISGWLAFFLIAQVVAVLMAVSPVISLPTTLRNGFRLGSVVAALGPLLVLETGVNLLVPVLILIGLVLSMRRDRRAPRLWFAYLTLSAAYLAIDLSVGRLLNSELARVLGSDSAKAADARGSSNLAMIRQIVVTLVWALYWVRSERVRGTFGAAALDKTARPIVRVEAAPSVTTPAANRRRRLALIAVVATVAVAIVVALTAWAGRVHPYSVGAGSDIRTKVVGRWDWTRRATPCADSAHVIAFSDDGKVMTIAQQNRWVDSLGRDRTTTTYDILSATRSTIRGAIRGEERMTSEGRPVVWDLVLVGPDEYRWHRTDWSSIWGYTAGIVRCDPRAPKRAFTGSRRPSSVVAS
jgi:hypothetical protein